ncbi:TraR/DksA family transcriptional regulator [Vreelandella piezotolerans]|uniref:TraR/DksA family transcriptional regulator n=1 Tax=Vreelandella piezotolerans TaxID=2609667 RepID=UPI001C638004|nr:TraR/DksA family transcriptional regulator [Halomonas piezotolerans]
MADNADIAADLMERRMQAALSSRLSLHIPNPDPECEDCGHEIPQARRNALPWATTCIECQSIREQRGRYGR